ncbi:putative nuclease HARBI1 [Ischnura elegans]|uniref:putative nuclease HARBI1 n=1 Tax=Ischnura elegans TaxID=197161 RepID=UPI001ED8AC32|nr:putative nuclease HARBI1 [Ischnura elegans]
MALHFLAWELMLLEERVNMMERRVQRRRLRDAQNPYDLPDAEFRRSFRISPELSLMITDSLRPFLIRQRSTGLSPEIQVLVAVNFYAHGSYQRTTGDRFDFCVSPSTVSRCLHSVTDLINQRLLRPWVKFPVSREDRQAARLKFRNAPQPFEGTLGAIDCTYINIIAPVDHEEAFVNHHQNHSLNVQAVVDPTLKVLNINARYPGARNDAYIWSVSPIRQVMEQNYGAGERHLWLIGMS